MTAQQRFWSKVEKTRGCWLWIGATSTKGYGRACVDGRFYQAHRLAYEWSKGLIPEGMQLNHLCRTRHCVNPAHLRPVTNRENSLAPGSLSPSKANAERLTCAKGHNLTPENTYRKPSHPSWRVCRTCKAESRTRDKRKNHHAAAPPEEKP